MLVHGTSLLFVAVGLVLSPFEYIQVRLPGWLISQECGCSCWDHSSFKQIYIISFSWNLCFGFFWVGKTTWNRIRAVLVEPFSDCAIPSLLGLTARCCNLFRSRLRATSLLNCVTCTNIVAEEQQQHKRQEHVGPGKTLPWCCRRV